MMIRVLLPPQRWMMVIRMSDNVCILFMRSCIVSVASVVVALLVVEQDKYPHTTTQQK